VLIERLATESAKTCIFCGDNAARRRPVIRRHVPGGRIEVGEAVLFATCFHRHLSSLIALSKAHFLKLSEFSSRILSDGFRAAKLFLRDIYQRDATIAFSTVNANYLLLRAQASSILICRCSRRYSLFYTQGFECLGRISGQERDRVFADLITEEKKAGERYNRQQGGWHWIASFSPTGATRSWGSTVGKRPHELKERDLRTSATGSRTSWPVRVPRTPELHYSFYSAKRRDRRFHCMIKIVNRQNLYPNYRNDDYSSRSCFSPS